MEGSHLKLGGESRGRGEESFLLHFSHSDRVMRSALFPHDDLAWFNAAAISSSESFSPRGGMRLLNMAPLTSIGP